MIDQNSLDTLKCFSCGNMMPWDANKFTIYKDSENDIMPAFKRNGLDVDENNMRLTPLEDIYLSAL
jgi:hypothetical protein